MKWPCVEDFVRHWIARVQPVTFIVDLDYRLVQRDVIRVGAAVGL